MSLNHRFTLYAPNIGISRPKTTYPHKEEHIWSISRMYESFNGTKDSKITQSDGTPRLTPTASDFQQGPISTASLQTTSARYYTIKNRISMSSTRHRIQLIQMNRMWKSQLHSSTRGIELMRGTSPNKWT